MHRIYQKLLIEINGDQNYLSCTDILYKNFGVLFTDGALDNANLVFTDMHVLLPTQTQFILMVYV